VFHAVKHLFSPWRSAYISGKQPRGCFLCRAAEPRLQSNAKRSRQFVGAGRSVKSVESVDEDRRNLVLFRGPKVFIIMNRYPYNNGHVMIAPYRHAGDVTKLTPAETRELFALLQRTVRILRQEMKPEGFNVGMNLGRIAGAGLADHVHLHVVPRWNGDTNFMPVNADTKVISEALATTWERLARRF